LNLCPRRYLHPDPRHRGGDVANQAIEPGRLNKGPERVRVVAEHAKFRVLEAMFGQEPGHGIGFGRRVADAVGKGMVDDHVGAGLFAEPPDPGRSRADVTGIRDKPQALAALTVLALFGFTGKPASSALRAANSAALRPMSVPGGRTVAMSQAVGTQRIAGHHQAPDRRSGNPAGAFRLQHVVLAHAHPADFGLPGCDAGVGAAFRADCGEHVGQDGVARELAVRGAPGLEVAEREPHETPGAAGDENGVIAAVHRAQPSRPVTGSRTVSQEDTDFTAVSDPSGCTYLPAMPSSLRKVPIAICHP